jgi:hypothetical protein
VDEEKLIILVQGHECLYNLQHKDYDKNLVKDGSWKEIAGELNAQDKELSQRTQHCWRMAGERHGMCESAFGLYKVLVWFGILYPVCVPSACYSCVRSIGGSRNSPCRLRSGA